MCSGIAVVLALAALRVASVQKSFITLRVSAKKAGPVRQDLQLKTVLSQSDNITTLSCTVQRVLNVCDQRRRTVLLWHRPMCFPRMKFLAPALGLPGLEKMVVPTVGPVAAAEESTWHRHKAVHSNRSSVSTQGLRWGHYA